MIEFISGFYPLLEMLNLPKYPSVVVLLLLSIFLSMTLLIFIFKRPKYKSFNPNPSAPPTPTKSDFDEALKSHRSGVEAHNARLSAERLEIMRCIGVLLSEKPPSTHAAAIELLDEYHAMFSLMVDALKEGSASFQSTVNHKEKGTIIHYLYELTMRGVSSSVSMSLERRHHTLLDKYRSYMDEHAQLNKEAISALLMGQNLPTVTRMATVQNSGLSVLSE